MSYLVGITIESLGGFSTAGEVGSGSAVKNTLGWADTGTTDDGACAGACDGASGMWDGDGLDVVITRGFGARGDVVVMTLTCVIALGLNSMLRCRPGGASTLWIYTSSSVSHGHHHHHRCAQSVPFLEAECSLAQAAAANLQTALPL